MKTFLLLMSIAVAVCGFSQKITITVSAQGKSVSASPDDENNDKVLVLQRSAAAAAAHLVAKVNKEEISAGWKRTFVVYDNEDKEIITLDSMKTNCYGVPLQALLPVLQQPKQYALYTIVLPEDPQKAMEVRIARQLVCKIQVTD
ncbi:MAG TPA: hypothetical protein VEV83_04775 [Parafilimonas sp.]|nr:hypothetical protein [Parafilimonas sp.]